MTRKAKPWRLRVFEADGDPTETFFTTERALFTSLPKGGIEGTVHHWERDRWVLFEVLDKTFFGVSE